MKVTNTNALPYSLMLEDGSYEVLEGGKSADLPIHKEHIERYKLKGFTFEGSEEAENSAAEGEEGGSEDGTDGNVVTPSQTRKNRRR